MIHAITATWAFDEANKRETLALRCPQCRREQSAPGKKIKEPITCEKCGTEIPRKSSAECSKMRQGDE